MRVDQLPYIVGIAGGSASGKTSLLRDLRAALPTEAVAVVSQDNYYLPKDQQHVDRNGHVNFDLPTSINRAEFHSDLTALAKGQTITRQEYTFNNASVEPEEVVVQPAPIIITEGLFIFYYAEIREMLDLKVYLDASEKVKLGRRIARDARDRGYDENTVRYQWDHHVMPAYREYLRPFRETTDLVIPNNTSYARGLQVLVSHLKSLVPQEVS